jgi:hypothetical protein
MPSLDVVAYGMLPARTSIKDAHPKETQAMEAEANSRGVLHGLLDKQPFLKRTLVRLRDQFRDRQPRLLVLGPPRSGFALLTSILNQLLTLKRLRTRPLTNELNAFVPNASETVYEAVEEYFAKHITLDTLVISPEFKLLVGGPKWLSKSNSDLACVRKYIGIRGMGDFLAVFSLPKCVMDFYPVVHSHYDPAQWLKDPYYTDYIKLSSIRNPLDIINSSMFSLNALTGEYIDKHVREDPNIIRDNLALYKLTDLNFIEGLITPLKDYLTAFIPVKNRYSVMRWEDLITEPGKTIFAISKSAGLTISEESAKHLWDRMKFKNQTAHHRHNFRKGIIGDWKNHLVNEHLEILKGQGFDEPLEVFGYKPIEYLKKSEYTPYQKTVAEYINKGQVYDRFEDKDLFTFAFNKSNFRSSKYEFTKYTSDSGLVEIERSSIQNEALLMGFIEALERALAPISETLKTIYKRHES